MRLSTPRPHTERVKPKRPRLAEAVLTSARLRLTVAALGLFLIGLIFVLRGRGIPATPVEPVPTPSVDADESGEDLSTPLEYPFFPTYENIWTLTSRAALEEHLYAVDETAFVYDEDLDIEAFLDMDFTTPLTGEPKILIFHTHSQEAFADSRPGVAEDTVIGVGAELARILAEKGISVVHDVGSYDVLNGVEYREGSYERMEPAIRRLLDKYPSIEITLDLHRDGVPDHVRLLTRIDDQPVARVMFFNGISRLNNRGIPEEVETLPNPYIPQNLALTLQLQLTANTMYPGFTRRIYIRPYRYSLHFTPKSMLVEVGANTNTVEEAMNAMKPLAQVLMRVLME